MALGVYPLLWHKIAVLWPNVFRLLSVGADHAIHHRQTLAALGFARGVIAKNSYFAHWRSWLLNEQYALFA